MHIQASVNTVRVRPLGLGFNGRRVVSPQVKLTDCELVSVDFMTRVQLLWQTFLAET